MSLHCRCISIATHMQSYSAGGAGLQRSKLCAKLESAQLLLVVYLLEKAKLITVLSFGQFSSDYGECLSWQVNDTIDEL